MENTNPMQDAPNDSTQPGDIRRPSLEVIHPGKQRLAEKLQVVRDLWAKYAPHAITLAGTLPGKVAIGAVAAAIAGGTILHYVHRKPATSINEHAHIMRVGHTPAHHIHKHVAAVNHAHKAVKSSSKATTSHKAAVTHKTTAHKKKHPATTGQTKPWLTDKSNQ